MPSAQKRKNQRARRKERDRTDQSGDGNNQGSASNHGNDTHDDNNNNQYEGSQNPANDQDNNSGDTGRQGSISEHNGQSQTNNHGKQPVQASGLPSLMEKLNITSASALLANHFPISVGDYSDLFQYDLKFKRVPKKTEAIQPKSKKSDKEKKKDEEEDGIGSAKKRRIVWLLMDQLKEGNPKLPMATNYKTQIITAGVLEHQDVPGTLTINYYDEYHQSPASDCEVFMITLSEPKHLSLIELMDYLSARHSATVYDDKEAAINALNIIFSYGPYQRCFLPPNQAAPSLTTKNGTKFYGIQTFPGNITATGNAFAQSAGLVSIPGFSRSVRTVKSTSGHIDLNINTSSAIFYERRGPDTVDTLIKSWVRINVESNVWSSSHTNTLSQFLRGLRVRTTHEALRNQPEYIGRVSSLAQTILPGRKPTPVNCSMIEPGLQSAPSVAQHFQAVYHQTYSHASNEFVVVLGEGDFSKTIPASFLNVIPGQVNGNTLELPRNSVRPPRINQQLIQNRGRGIFYGGHPNEPGASQFQLIPQGQMIQVPARCLALPSVCYRPASNPTELEDVDVDGRKYGTWDLRGRQFYRACPSSTWTYLELTLPGKVPCTENNLLRFKNTFGTILRNQGLANFSFQGGSLRAQRRQMPSANLPRPDQEEERAKQYTFVLTELQKAKDEGINLVVVLLPLKDVELYSAVKQAGDQVVGIATVCHVQTPGKTANAPAEIKSSADFVANLSMKINLKLSSRSANQALNPKGPILTTETMIIGIDVTHPPPTTLEGAPSVAAVVGNIDDQFAQWPASLRVNYAGTEDEDENPSDAKPKKKSKEEVMDLAEMVYERVLAYSQNKENRVNKNALPDKIIIYRDGLSEAQYTMCKTKEIPRIRAGLTKLLGGEKHPPIMLVCTVKRHFTRFFPAEGSTDKSILIGSGPKGRERFNDNPLPGTLVTDRITYGEIDVQDFFLISHKAIQGTARPTHYVILENETRHSRDAIAQMVSWIRLDSFRAHNVLIMDTDAQPMLPLRPLDSFRWLLSSRILRRPGRWSCEMLHAEHLPPRQKESF